MIAERQQEAAAWMNPALADAQGYGRAMLNILEDSAAETSRVGDSQRAVLNMLDDMQLEASRLADTQRAVLNILEDAGVETIRLADTQRAVLNILDDVAVEKALAERANIDLRHEVVERELAVEALRQANAEVQTANRELEAFSYSVAHDLRAPLRSIDGFSQALVEDYDDKLDANGRNYLSLVRAAAIHMARLIDDLLSLARIGRAELVAEEIDLAAIARKAVERLRLEQADRRIDLVIPAKLPACGDPKLLAIAIENLVGNAWKFTGKCASPRIEVGHTSQDGRDVYFVRDNGAGFDMAYSEKLFAVFQRLHTVGEFDGLGIGLATVQRVISRHGGKIWAEGHVDQGATFYFTLRESA
jgi:light-regulated signal transduction histidine kinase (bacteriophytochrome)